MDRRHFDALTRSLTKRGTRRSLLVLLATLPALAGLLLLAPLDLDETDAKGQRKKARKHGRRRRRRHRKPCHAESKGKTCSGTCGLVKNSCRKTVDCGSCVCASTADCDDGSLCLPDGTCQPCDVTCPGGACAGTALQDALAAPGPNTTIYVCPGIYTGNFTLATNVTVIGSGQGDDERVDTILDAQNSGRVVTTGGAAVAELHRLRIRGGNSNNGGGLHNSGATVSLIDCTITGNNAGNELAASGGGVYSANALTNLTRCAVSFNTANSSNPTATGSGGGLLHFGSGKLTLTDSRITDNTAKSTGAGLGVANNGTAELVDCEVTRNVLAGPIGPATGGIAVGFGSSVSLTDSFVWANTAPDCAGNITESGDGGCGEAPPPV